MTTTARYELIDTATGARVPMYPHTYDKVDAAYLLRCAKDIGYEAELREVV